MKTTIDRAGRVVIPRDIREAAGLKPGTSVEIEVRKGVVSIEPAAATVKLVKRGRLRVAVSEPEGKVLSEAEVRAARDRVRQ